MRWPDLHPRAWPLTGGCWVCLAWGRERLCAACRDRLAPALPRCPGCALAGFEALCGHCRRHPLGLDHCLAPVDYQAPWDALLQALKYRSALGAAEALAELWPTRIATPALLLPVPQHPQRWRERGHHPAQLLAQALGRRLRLPVLEEALLRLRDTPSQTRLNRAERQRNLHAAFALAPGVDLRGRSLLIVDDVLTTGATVAALAQLLRRHGAARVEAWVIARTPEPGH